MNSYIEKMMAHNRKFVEDHAYEPYRADKYPRTGIAILTCMDTRLVTLLPAALGLQNGDVKMIRNAGAFINDPYGDAVRSLLVAIYELKVNEIMVIGHTNCGVQGLTGEEMLELMTEKGIPEETITSVKETVPDIEERLNGFSEVNESVRKSVRILREHPLIPEYVHIGGYVMDVVTGELKVTEE